MRSNLKALALALAAVFAMSAIAAGSAAAAEEHQFNSEVEPTIIEGTSHAETTQDFELENGLKVECPVLHAEGTAATKAQDELTVEIDYTGSGENGHCDGGGDKTNIEVKDEGCHYTLDSDTTAGNSTGGEHADVTLTCPSNGGITLTDTNTGLDILVKNQTIEDAVSYENTGAGTSRDVTVKATAHGIEWECENTTFFCSIATGGKSGNDASYTGSVTAQGFKDEGGKKGAQVGIWVE
jgi:hypothetical protein